MDLVNDRVDRQVSRKVLVLLEQHSGLSRGFECERARVVRGTGCFQVYAQGLCRPGQAADCSRQSFRYRATWLYYGERGARERPYVADGQVYLVGCAGVEFEVPEASSPRRSEPRGLAAGNDGFFQPTDPRVDLLGFQVSSLDPLGITFVKPARYLLERVDRLVEEGVYAASVTMRSGFTGSSALTSKAVPPPISASRNRSSGNAASEDRKVIMMISAETTASFTPISCLPRNAATVIARATTIPACTAPTRRMDTRKSAISIPKATPTVSSTARRPRSLTANPSEMTAAIGANVGRSSPRSRTARNHATHAATAVCRICNHPPLRRRPPERRRLRNRAKNLTFINAKAMPRKGLETSCII